MATETVSESPLANHVKVRREVTITRREVVGSRIVALDLGPADGQPLPEWEPGAHVDLSLPGGLTRSYSLIPSLRPGTWRIAVLNERKSRGGSRWIHEAAQVDTVITAVGIRNNFPLEPTPGGHVFVAGGIGVTPLLSMISSLRQSGGSWELHLSVREAADLGVVQDLLTLPQVHVYRASHGERLNLGSVCRAMGSDALMYICGPRGMLKEVETHFRPGDRRYRCELFAAAEPVFVAQNSGFIVECVRSAVRAEVASGESILTAVHRGGVVVTSSCEEGVCGSCETKVLAGSIDHRDSILSDEERESGDTMMICVSRSLGGLLVLDL